MDSGWGRESGQQKPSGGRGHLASQRVLTGRAAGHGNPRGKGLKARHPRASKKTASGSERLTGHLSKREIWETMRGVNRALAQTNSTSRSPCCGSWAHVPLSELQLPFRPSRQRHKVPNARSVATFREMDTFSERALNVRNEGIRRL